MKRSIKKHAADKPAADAPVAKKRVDGKTKAIAVLKCVGLSAWTGLATLGTQFALSYIMFWILGAERLEEPLWTTVYTALTYVIAFVVVLVVTPKLLDLGSFLGRKFVAKKPHKAPATVSEQTAAVATSSEELQSAAPSNRKPHKAPKHKMATWAEMGIKGLPTWTDIGLSVVGYIIAILLATGLSFLFQLFPWYNAEETQSLAYSPYLWGADRILAFLGLVVVAPIAEELIFRGWLYGKLRETLGDKLGKKFSVVVAIIMVSLVFGILHGQWNVGVTVFALSVVMCTLREITGTIYSGILVHVIKNALAFFLLYVIGK